MNLRLLMLPALSLLLLHTACFFGDEAAVRAVVSDFFERAQAGKVEKALELVIPEHPTARLLASIQEENPDRYKKAVAEMAQEMRKSLSSAVLHISSVESTGSRAIVRLVILRKSAEEESSIAAVKRSGKWMLETLPSISESDF